MLNELFDIQNIRFFSEYGSFFQTNAATIVLDITQVLSRHTQFFSKCFLGHFFTLAYRQQKQAYC